MKGNLKVRVKVIGLPEPLPGLEDGKEVKIDFPGATVKELLHHLSLGIGPKQKEIFLNGEGEISPMLFVCINGNSVGRLNARVHDDGFIEIIFPGG